MKNQSNVVELTALEMMAVNGGDGGVTPETSFIQDVSYVVGRTARGFWEWCKMASEFQGSMPANLKK